LGDVGHEFEFVAIEQWDVPADRSTESGIRDGRISGLRPREEHSGLYGSRLSECLKYGRVILDGMRRNDRQSWSSHGFEEGRRGPWSRELRPRVSQPHCTQ